MRHNNTTNVLYPRRDEPVSMDMVNTIAVNPQEPVLSEWIKYPKETGEIHPGPVGLETMDVLVGASW